MAGPGTRAGGSIGGRSDWRTVVEQVEGDMKGGMEFSLPSWPSPRYSSRFLLLMPREGVWHPEATQHLV
jgi:hypothetical protein